ncbi:uncharacterized protein LOC133720498 [Rosa rugosa]|uniref:uncharacterized protein LOC133720498 n=1 Tax=Rosa rugosa TaxID=74645 RepID=UPI002B401C76|nr:uncharacterized protein LOC133720498 [Rosa rugosa]
MIVSWVSSYAVTPSMFGFQVNNENYAFPILENLEHLELFVHPDYDLGLRHLTSFMEASPYMQRLVLKLGFSPPYCIYGGRAEKAVKCPHRYLKVVEIVGYRRHEHTLRHVKYLINNVVALEKIIVDPVKRWLYGPKMDRETRVIVDEAKARAHAVTHLEEEIPSTIEFVCL